MALVWEPSRVYNDTEFCNEANIIIVVDGWLIPLRVALIRYLAYFIGFYERTVQHTFEPFISLKLV